MTDNEISITVGNRSQNIDVNTGESNNQIGISGDNSQYFSNEARKSAELAAQSATEAQEYAEQAESFKNELLNDTGFVAVKDNINSIITNAVNIEDINTVAENIDDIADASLLANEFVEIWEAGVANNDLSNLTEQGEKHFLNKQQITNCLLEVPQRIKLELSSGILTLKAGSQVIVPNGFEADGVTPKFDYVTVESDITATSNSDRICFHFVGGTGTYIERYPTEACYSGATAPTTFQYMMWYDTTNNVVKKTSNNGATWISGISLPIGLFIESTSGIKTIDQIFNGFGYIGSTVWVDKGVKGLIPNGRNADGTLNNREFVADKVLTRTMTTENYNAVFAFSDNSIARGGIDYYVYDEKNNYNLSAGDIWDVCVFAQGKLTNGVISNFQPKFPFRAVDYSDLDTKVNKSGDTIKGQLTGISSPYPFIAQSNIMDITTTPSTNQFIGYDFRDKNGTRVGWAGVVNGSNNIKYFQIQNIGGVNGFNFPMCTTRPSTTSSASANKVAVVVQNYRNGTSGLTLWSDGRLEQWGIVYCASAGQQNTTTFLKPYLSDRGYTLVMAQERAAAGDAGFPVFHTPLATGFTIIGDSTSYVNWLAIGYV